MPEDVSLTVTELMKRLRVIIADFRDKISVRNYAIAEYIGWYEKPDSMMGVWYAKDSNGEEFIAYNYVEQGGEFLLPFYENMGYLCPVVDLIWQRIPDADSCLNNYEKDHWYISRWEISLGTFICWLVEWNGKNFNEDDPDAGAIYYKVGENAINYGDALFFMVGDIILTVSGRANEIT